MGLDLRHKRVTILGAQKSGLAAAALALSKGAHVSISDHGDFSKASKETLAWIKGHDITQEWNGHTRAFIEKSDILVLSPGVPLQAEPVAWAQEKNIPVIGEIEFAYQWCTKPVIAITGSNGKTTVSTLTHQVLEHDGKSSCLCGNIGTPFSQHVHNDEAVDFFVLEVSSFQMEALVENPFTGMNMFRPHIAVVLNFSDNHLDRHRDLDDYLRAKTRIFKNQTADDVAIIDGTNRKLLDAVRGIKAPVRHIGKTQAWQGTYNHNQLAVLEIARVLGIPEETCREVFGRFKGVEHRMEWVRLLNGVDYINDSKATTAEAGRWALMQVDRPVVMICGGRDKNIDFSSLKDVVKEKVKCMILIGEAREKLKSVFQGVASLRECETLKDAVDQAREVSQKGDCVLLSPMCASFDMFRNFEDRGQCFKRIVQELQ